jgi:hypothetical protein
MAVWFVVLLPAAPLLVAGLLSEELVLLGISGVKAAYNAGAYGVSRWLGGRSVAAS